MTRRPALVSAVGAVALVLGLSACDTGGDPSASPGSTAASAGTTAPMPALLDVLPGLCAARDRAASDLNSARVSFYARAHDPLHTIARDLEPVDRALAARLLEAKGAVETNLNAADGTVPTLVADLDVLIDVTSRALERLSIAGDPCP